MQLLPFLVQELPRVSLHTQQAVWCVACCCGDTKMGTLINMRAPHLGLVRAT
jgi:hypothetical protein